MVVTAFFTIRGFLQWRLYRKRVQEVCCSYYYSY